MISCRVMFYSERSPRPSSAVSVLSLVGTTRTGDDARMLATRGRFAQGKRTAQQILSKVAFWRVRSEISPRIVLAPATQFVGRSIAAMARAGPGSLVGKPSGWLTRSSIRIALFSGWKN